MHIERFNKLPVSKQQAILTAGIHTFSLTSYQEAGTDAITAACGISKGLLFHYFGTKKTFYLYCLETALARLMPPSPANSATATGVTGSSAFYAILFHVMDEKFRLCRQFPDEMRMVNLSARDASREISQDKQALFATYAATTTAMSNEVMARAFDALPLKNPADPQVHVALRLYINVIINHYLLLYRDTPDAFFDREDTVKAELRRDIDYFLYGICTT